MANLTDTMTRTARERIVISLGWSGRALMGSPWLSGGRTIQGSSLRRRLELGGAAFVVTLLLLVPPAAGYRSGSTIIPPFRHSAATSIAIATHPGPCRSTASVVPPHWNASSGNITGAAYSSAHSCWIQKPGLGYARSVSAFSLMVAIPIPIFRNSGNPFAVNFSYAFSFVGTIHGMHYCPTAKNINRTRTSITCRVAVSDEALARMRLYDQTNHSYLSGVDSATLLARSWTVEWNVSTCNGYGSCVSRSANTSCSYPANSFCVAWGPVVGSRSTWLNAGANCIGRAHGGHCGQWQNWTLNSTHRYWILGEIEVVAAVAVQGYGVGLAAVASVNGASHGNTGWRLANIED